APCAATRSPLLPPLPPTAPVFPYTTLFRSLLRSPPGREPAGAPDLGSGGHPAEKWREDDHSIHQLGMLLGGIECRKTPNGRAYRSEEHTSELQSRENLVCRLLLEKKKQQMH